MEYTIDLCSFNVEADSEEEALEIAHRLIQEGDIRIDQVLPCD